MKVGDKVKIPHMVREAWNVQHLTGEYRITEVDGNLITFHTGERVNHHSPFCKRGERRWHRKSLILVDNGITRNE